MVSASVFPWGLGAINQEPILCALIGAFYDIRFQSPFANRHGVAYECHKKRNTPLE